MSKAMLVSLIIIGVIALVTVVYYIADYSFDQKTKKEVKALFMDVKATNNIIIKEDLIGLPVCVQKWLKKSQVIGKERISTVRLKQKTELRLKENQQWMPAEVKQYFSTEKPGFVWTAKVKAAPFVNFAGRDKFTAGKGHMNIKLFSLITIANGKGKEINQGTLLRYLAEMVWFPSAALNSYISWEKIDNNSAKATMSYGGTTASGTFTFNEKGEVLNFQADRYGEFDGEYRMEKWMVQINEYKEFHGYVIPNKGEVIWRLKSGDFNWYQWEIEDIEYNKPNIYPH